MVNSLAETCINRQLTAVQRLHSVIKTDEYARILSGIIAVGLRNYAAHVLIAGVGKNASIASKISDTMVSLGIPSFPLNVSHLGHGDFGRIGPQDFIIYISRSGTTREILAAMKHVQTIRPHVAQVLIHCNENKKLSGFADLELCIGGVIEGDELELAPTTSTTALLCILDCLSVEASQNLGFSRLDFLQYHPEGALGEMLQRELKLQQNEDGE